MGAIDVQAEYADRRVSLELLIVKGDGPTLMGRNWLSQFPDVNWGQLHSVTDSGQCNVEAILAKYNDLFKPGLGKVGGVTAKLYLKPDEKPKFCRPRTVPYAAKSKIKDEINRQVDDGILEPVSFSEWATPVVPVLKKDGSVRLCGDYKVTLNQATLTETYTLPRIDDILASLAGGTAFTKLDLAHAYQQVMLDEKSKRMATITTHKGLYQVNRSCIKSTGCPSVSPPLHPCSRVNESWRLYFKDFSRYSSTYDILVTGWNLDEHLQNLEAVLARLHKSGFRLKREKCAFFLPSVDFLGHRITASGIQPSPDKVKAVQEAPTPQDVSQLKSFIGLVNYDGKFLPDLSNLLAPLHRLMQKDAKWSWGAEQAQAFREVKRMLTSDCLLVQFDPDWELLLAWDASPYGVGAVHSHRGPDGKEQPVAFASLSLNLAEKNYSQLEKEGLAIVFAVKKFHQFLFGRPFTITSDHKPLQHLLKPSNAVSTMASARMQRWALLLSGYDYSISYKPGEQHANADSLSRLPLPESPESFSLPPETIHLMQQLDASPVTSDLIKRMTGQDPLLSKVRDLVLQGGSYPTPEVVKPYHKYWNELSVHAGCLLRGSRAVVPPQARAKVVELMHEGERANDESCPLLRLVARYRSRPGEQGQIL